MKSKLLYQAALLLILSSCNRLEVIEKYDSGKVKLECELVDGKKNGNCIQYYSTGEKELTCEYKNDIENGVCKIFHRNGTPHWSGNFINGRRNGVIDYFDSLGVRYQTSSFKEDLLDGDSFSYYSNGNIQSRMTYKKGELDGLYQSFFIDGGIRKEANYSHNIQLDYVLRDSTGKVVEHLIKYEIHKEVKIDHYIFSIQIINPLYDVMGLKIINGEKEEALYDTDFKIEYRVPITQMDTLKGYILDMDTLDSGKAVIKCSRYFEYYIRGAKVMSSKGA